MEQVTSNAVIMAALIVGLPCLTTLAIVLMTHRHNEQLAEIKAGLRQPRDSRG